MGENSKIEWTDATFNPWVGCTKLSPACDNCYAETWARRTGHPELWQGERRRTSAAYWQQPLKWNRRAEADGRRLRVFCASLADVFDNQVPERWRDDLWHRIEQTPHLDWLLLTKRPQNVAKMLPDPRIGVKPWGNGWPNVWLGTTAENQEEADRRIPLLLQTPAAARFVSAEPLLGPIDLRRWVGGPDEDGNCLRCGCLWDDASEEHECPPGFGGRLDWIIVGGESGPNARELEIEWVRNLVQQCARAKVPCFLKQLGQKVRDRNDRGFEGEEPDHWDVQGDYDRIEHDPDGYRDGYQGAPVRIHLRDRKGGNPDEWPADLRVREFPSPQGGGR